MKKITYIFISLVAVAALASCDKFLDKNPDNRSNVDSVEKVSALLTSAYPETCYIMLTELLSDNVDDYRVSYKSSTRFFDEVFAWNDSIESDNESSERIWQSSYSAIASANLALQSIPVIMENQHLSNADRTILEECRAEALLCRAYNHFMLVNIFAWNYNNLPESDPFSAKNMLGVPYMEKSETALNPKYQRNTVAEVYALIEKDLEEALPLIGDSHYTVPKYHFNRQAAYSFAARFYLYYEKWDKAVACANECLGSNAEGMLRRWDYLASLPTKYTQIVNSFIDASESCNLLLCTAYSNVGLAFGPYAICTAYSHGAYAAEREDILATQIWGTGSDRYKFTPKIYENALDRVIFWKIPYLFEYTDPVAQIGYRRTVYPALWADETLLVRAEANVMLENYDDAAADLTLWINNMTKNTRSFSKNDFVNFYNRADYYQWNQPTVKKHLNPTFDIGTEKGTKEAMLQAVIGIRRIETIQQGLRWFDIKRYGIEVERRIMNAAGKAQTKSDELPVDDLRRAVQIPQKVTDAGLARNPR